MLLALLLAGCPDEIGRGSTQVIVSGLLAPSSLTAVANGGSQVLLTWADHATTESGYRLEMAIDAFNGMATILDVRYLPANATAFVYPTFPNTTYFFRVFAITSTMESDPSNIAISYTPNVPVQPTGVVANPHTSSEIALSWNDVSGETGYVIERSIDGGLTWTGVGSAPPDTRSLVSTGMTPDSEYAHRIVAVNVFGRSTPSDPAFAQTTTAAMSFYAPGLSGNSGQFTSYAVEPGGREHVAHYELATSNVLYASRLAPGSYVTTTIDAGPTASEDVGGDGTGIAVDPSGKVHIVAHDRTNDRPRYSTNAGGAWVATTLDSHPSGAQPRIVCDRATGELHVSYLDSVVSAGASLIRYTRKPLGGTWRPPGGVNYSLPALRHSLALDPAGIPFLLGMDQGFQMRVYYGLLGGGTTPGGVPPMFWSPLPAVASPQPAPQVDDTDMAIDEFGSVHVVFHERTSGALYHAFSFGPNWTLETVDQSEGFDLGAFCAVAAQPVSRRVHVAYFDATRKDLRYARKDPGGPWVRRIIEAVGEVGSHASISVDGTGMVYIAYRDETNRRLRVAIGRP